MSKADKVVAKEEYKLIMQMAKGLGLEKEEALKIINHPGTISKFKSLLADEKFEYLLKVVHLMKVDGKIHRNEIAFCEKPAIRLGYKPGVISVLSAYIIRTQLLIQTGTISSLLQISI